MRRERGGSLEDGAGEAGLLWAGSRLKRLPYGGRIPERVRWSRPRGQRAARPQRGRRTPAASGQPRRRAGEPREGRERGRVPASTVSTFLRREGQSSDENRPGRARGLRTVRRLCNRRRGEWKREVTSGTARPGREDAQLGRRP